jgi:hypothetical protein
MVIFMNTATLLSRKVCEHWEAAKLIVADTSFTNFIFSFKNISTAIVPSIKM